jgi:hypothetical protein
LSFESIASQLQNDLTIRKTRNLLAGIVFIASHVNVNELFEVAHEPDFVVMWTLLDLF